MNISFSKTFHVVASIIGVVAIMHFGKVLLIPVFFALLSAFILYPTVKWLKGRGLKRVLSILLSMVGVFVLFAGLLVMFSAQIIEMAGQYTLFVDKLKVTLEKSIDFLNDHVGIIPDIEAETITQRLADFFSDSGFVIISDTVSVTGSFFSFLVLTSIYTFLILFYSDHLTQSVSSFTTKAKRSDFVKMLKEVQKVGQQYFTGMLLLILVLGVLNSLGLLVLGIDYPFFFGFLAALLAIIPYVGTALGGLIPTIYAFVAFDSYWYPLGVIIIFWFIQFIEGNILSPRIVGGNMQINALFSILSLIAGSLLWGIAGMILFLPMTAMLKVVCTYFDDLEPVASLIGDKVLGVKSGQGDGFLQELKEKLKF